jgi:hypothetical protein
MKGSLFYFPTHIQPCTSKYYTYMEIQNHALWEPRSKKMRDYDRCRANQDKSLRVHKYKTNRKITNKDILLWWWGCRVSRSPRPLEFLWLSSTIENSYPGFLQMGIIFPVRHSHKPIAAPCSLHYWRYVLQRAVECPMRWHRVARAKHFWLWNLCSIQNFASIIIKAWHNHPKEVQDGPLGNDGTFTVKRKLVVFAMHWCKHSGCSARHFQVQSYLRVLVNVCIQLYGTIIWCLFT